MAYEPRFTIHLHHHPRGFFASCDPDGSGEELLTNTHPMPGDALRQLAYKVDAYADAQAEVQSDRRVMA